MSQDGDCSQTQWGTQENRGYAVTQQGICLTDTSHEVSFHVGKLGSRRKIKSVLDVWNSFHLVPLVEEDRDKTIFIIPWGRYRHRVLLQGYLTSMDGYTH